MHTINWHEHRMPTQFVFLAKFSTKVATKLAFFFEGYFEFLFFFLSSRLECDNWQAQIMCWSEKLHSSHVSAGSAYMWYTMKQMKWFSCLYACESMFYCNFFLLVTIHVFFFELWITWIDALIEMSRHTNRDELVHQEFSAQSFLAFSCTKSVMNVLLKLEFWKLKIVKIFVVK